MHLETILFQATMPGIAEEIVFRGILLALLNKVFAMRWTLFGVRLGWGAIISSILFGLLHGFYIDNAWSLHFITIGILRTAFDGFFLALVKERTKSLLPGIIIHNVLDVIVCFW
jgi:membrane protease YdiL (CAAX protease family)